MAQPLLDEVYIYLPLNYISASITEFGGTNIHTNFGGFELVVVYRKTDECNVPYYDFPHLDYQFPSIKHVLEYQLRKMRTEYRNLDESFMFEYAVKSLILEVNGRSSFEEHLQWLLYVFENLRETKA